MSIRERGEMELEEGVRSRKDFQDGRNISVSLCLWEKSSSGKIKDIIMRLKNCESNICELARGNMM